MGGAPPATDVEIELPMARFLRNFHDAVKSAFGSSRF